MKYGWFKPWGWIYRPIAWQGVLLVLLTIVFCVQVFIAVDRLPRHALLRHQHREQTHPETGA
jgi:hypothetical protein